MNDVGLSQEIIQFLSELFTYKPALGAIANHLCSPSLLHVQSKEERRPYACGVVRAMFRLRIGCLLLFDLSHTCLYYGDRFTWSMLKLYIPQT